MRRESALSRRDLRTQSGVLTPGIDPKKTPTLTRRIKNRPRSRARKVGLVSSGVLEFCAKSELHPVRGLGMLKGWQMVVPPFNQSTYSPTHNVAPLSRPVGADLFRDNPGIKPQAESLSPFGTKPLREPRPTKLPACN
jgi:hypothetical protein